MDINRIINVAAYAGKIMLESGAEIYRVEETITRICEACNIKNATPFVTPTVVMVSASNQYGQTITLIKRVKSRTVNLEKICEVNDISRNIRNKGLTLNFIEKKLKQVELCKPYSNSINILMSGIVASSFTLVFGGNTKDFLVSLAIGCIIKLASIFLSLLQTNEFFINIICGSMTAILALVSTYLNVGTHSDKIIVGSIMLLVPGLAITNAIRDTIAGDLISGITRAIEAVLIAVGIAIGTGVVLKFWFFI
ncbi:threonine/serine exporter ThrE family protein [Clostridium sp. DJ247]|uniref:threonine/serine ThrE exporter family protein n=1 Tax=Clostridium sp. DJ247 TaxID=2726188 RepID=UPI001627C104|nr:threonine/serine exporter family protein [Clostridium sp. DJ247]MBC2580365.1 threonine/serine exporter family protein [Clostridium sp. DJ247]